MEVMSEVNFKAKDVLSRSTFKRKNFPGKKEKVLLGCRYFWIPIINETMFSAVEGDNPV